MLWFLISCLLSMEVADKETSVAIKNTGFPSCNRRANIGLESSIQIGSLLKDGRGGWGSGNYMKLGKYKFILTAAHVIDQGEIFTMAGEEKIPLKVIYKNIQRDVAIVVPLTKLPNKPRHFKANTTTQIEGVGVNYAGYPSDIGKSVYTGQVARSTQEVAMVQGFALPGSSGSVVFDNKGRVIGVVSAVKLFQTVFSPFPELIETLVYVERSAFINKRFLKEVFMSANQKQ